MASGMLLASLLCAYSSISFQYIGKWIRMVTIQHQPNALSNALQALRPNQPFSLVKLARTSQKNCLNEALSCEIVDRIQ